MKALLTLARWLTLPIVWLFRSLGWFLGNSKNRKRFWIGTGVIVVGLGITAELLLDARHLLWHPLSIDDRAGFATDLKLRAIRLGPEAWCERLMARSATLRVTPVAAKDGDGDCGWSRAYSIGASEDITLTGAPPYPMRCALAAGAHIWLTSVDHHAREILGSELSRVHHVGTYSCRRMYNRPSGRMSQHAYANAWDVTGFELADGRVVSVLQHWQPRGPLRDFLRAVRDDACRIFDVVLGPDFNEAHRDHLHVDMGLGIRCS